MILSKALIYARVTINGKRLEISLKRSIDSLFWDGKKGCIQGNKEFACKINPYIEEVRYKLMESYQQLRMQGSFISVHTLKNLFLGEEKNENTLNGLLIYHRAHSKNILKPGTMKNYSATENYIGQFLKLRYKTNDISLEQLNYQFITEFELFLRTTRPLDAKNPLGNNGIMKHMERLRKIVTVAVKMEWLPKDPFVRYKLRFQRTEREFLIEDEIRILENISLSSKTQEKCRDLFVFSCYIGLSYIDLANLNAYNISIGIDGEYWLKNLPAKNGY